MAASSSMINTVPEREACASPGCRMMTTASDIDCLPHQREFEIKRRAFARMTFDPNFSAVLLNNAVSDRNCKPSTSASPLARRGVRGDVRAGNTVNLFLRYNSTSSANHHTDPVTFG